MASATHLVTNRDPYSFPYFDNPVYSIKLTLESKDAGYLEGAYAALLILLAKIDLTPVATNKY